MARVILFAVLVVAPALSQGSVKGHGSARRFISQKYGFSMAVPADWSVSIGLDTPVYFYAPRSARFVQDQIPKGGAVITTESGQRWPARTPEEWAHADALSEASTAPPIEKFQFPPESGASHAVMCAYDEAKFSLDERKQHSVAIYWEFRGGLFAARLRYNTDDKAGPSFEEVFLQTVRGIRPLRSRRGL
jgi:hypothetical protein